MSFASISAYEVTSLMCKRLEDIRDFMESLAKAGLAERLLKRGGIHEQLSDHKVQLDRTFQNFLVSIRLVG